MSGWCIRHVDGQRWRTLDSLGMPDWTDDESKALCLRLREHADAYAADDPEDVRIVPASEDWSRSALAGRLIDVWCADKGKQIPWAKAVQIVAIVTKQSDDERDRLLRMGDEDGSCGMCGRSDAPAEVEPRT